MGVVLPLASAIQAPHVLRDVKVGPLSVPAAGEGERTGVSPTCVSMLQAHWARLLMWAVGEDDARARRKGMRVVKCIFFFGKKVESFNARVFS